MNRRTFMSVLGSMMAFLGMGAKKPEELPLANEQDEKYKYSKFIKKCDEATMNEFRNLVLIDEEGDDWTVPVVWGNDELANTAMERRTSLIAMVSDFVKDKIHLPLVNIYNDGLGVFDNKIHISYCMTVNALYREDMNQLIEQVIHRFNPTLKRAVGEYKIDGIMNNVNEHEVKMVKVNKYKFNFTLVAKGKP